MSIRNEIPELLVTVLQNEVNGRISVKRNGVITISRKVNNVRTGVILRTQIINGNLAITIPDGKGGNRLYGVATGPIVGELNVGNITHSEFRAAICRRIGNDFIPHLLPLLKQSEPGHLQSNVLNTLTDILHDVIECMDREDTASEVTSGEIIRDDRGTGIYFMIDEHKDEDGFTVPRMKIGLEDIIVEFDKPLTLRVSMITDTIMYHKQIELKTSGLNFELEEDTRIQLFELIDSLIAAATNIYTTEKRSTNLHERNP